MGDSRAGKTKLTVNRKGKEKWGVSKTLKCSSSNRSKNRNVANETPKAKKDRCPEGCVTELGVKASILCDMSKQPWKNSETLRRLTANLAGLTREGSTATAETHDSCDH